MKITLLFDFDYYFINQRIRYFNLNLVSKIKAGSKNLHLCLNNFFSSTLLLNALVLLLYWVLFVRKNNSFYISTIRKKLQKVYYWLVYTRTRNVDKQIKHIHITIIVPSRWKYTLAYCINITKIAYRNNFVESIQIEKRAYLNESSLWGNLLYIFCDVHLLHNIPKGLVSE